MEVKKTGNIIHYNFRKPEEKTENKANNPDNPIVRRDNNLGAVNYPVIPMNIISLLNSAYDAKANEIALAEYFKETGIEVSGEMIKEGLRKYRKDAELMKDMPKIASDFIKQFETDIQDIDFAGTDRIRNIFGDGNTSLKADVKNNLLGNDYDFDYAPSEKSLTVLTPIVESYAHILGSKLPQYQISVIKTYDSKNKKICELVEISKDGITLRFEPQDFVASMTLKKLCGDNFVIKEVSDDSADYYLLYDTMEEIIQKCDKEKDILVGICSTECYDEKGEPQFFLDETDNIDFSIGPVFYVLKEYTSLKGLQQRVEMQLDFEEGRYDSETLEKLLSMVQQDEELREFYDKGYGSTFFMSCIRNGMVNLNVADAMDYLFEFTFDWEYGMPSFEYINNIINILEEEDNTFDYDLLDLARSFLLREKEAKEDWQFFIYEALTFIKTNGTEENFDALAQMAQSDFLTLDECMKLLRILELFDDESEDEAKLELCKLAKENAGKWGSLEDSMKVYNRYFRKYLYPSN